MSGLAPLLQTGIAIALSGLLIAAAWQDLRTLHIANGLSIAIATLFIGWAVFGLIAGSYTWQAFGLSIVCGACLFVVGAAAFAGGIVGGGDVKLLAAVGLFAGPGWIVDLLLVTALVGGALGVAVLAGAPIGPAATAGEVALRRRLPYGPAIAMGGLWVASALTVG